MPKSPNVQSSKQQESAADEAADGNVGARLRSLRELFGISQRELARKAGVTNGTVSMIEQARVSPSVGSLKKLTDALSVTLADFFTMDLSRPAGPFFSKDQLVEIGGGDVSLQLVPPGVPNAQLQVLTEHYPPGADTGPEPITHAGEEAGVVVQGCIELTVGGREKTLSAGDAYYFDSRVPHRFRNLSDEDCQVVSAATPRTF